MKKNVKIALAILGAALVLGTASCSNGSDSPNPLVPPATPTTPATDNTDNGGSGGSEGGEQGGGGGSQQQTAATYNINVTGGTAKNAAGTIVTSAAVGDVITIVANAPEVGKAFDKWTTSTSGVTFEIETSSSTTFTMPSSEVSVTANYKNSAPEGFVTVEGSTVVGGSKFNRYERTGCFIYGRSVTIPTFWMCDHEVTQAEYVAVMESNPSSYNGASGKEPASGEIQNDRPVETVSWYDAIYYCNKKSLSESLTPCYTVNGKEDPSLWGYTPHSGRNLNPSTCFSETAINGTIICDFTANGYRLPTEAEWEYAARGGKAGCEVDNPNCWSGTDDISDLSKYAWYESNSNNRTHAVKTEKRAGIDSSNSLGIYDMTGNVWEWCWDFYNTIKTTTPWTGPDSPSSGFRRVFIGGSFATSRNNCTVVDRDVNISAYGLVGFRVVRTAQ